MGDKTYKLALVAGHYLGTPGKCCLKAIDSSETKEWLLNDRVADLVEAKLSGYKNIEVLRIDDTSGQKDIALDKRIATANKWDADLYISIHHNAGIDGGSGGGTVVFTCLNPISESKAWQSVIYDSIIKYTGLIGNRSTPKAEKNLAECRDTAMPAVLIENGFMDSTTDTPIILGADHAEKTAKGIVEAIVTKWQLSPKTATPELPNAKLVQLLRAKESAKNAASAAENAIKDAESAIKAAEAARDAAMQVDTSIGDLIKNW